MEFKMTTDLATTVPQIIDFNNEELKRELAANLEKYQGLVVTDDAIPAAKSDRAKLNKFKDAIETKRKEIKKVYLAPYNEFEAKCKELTTMVDEPIKTIDDQIKAFEEEKKAIKRHEIEEYFSSAMGDAATIYPLSLIWDNRWLNSSFKLKDAQSIIDETKAKIGRDTEAIRALKSDNEAYLLDVYAKTLDISSAIAEQKRFEERAKQQAEIEERQRLAKIKVAEAVSKPEPIIEQEVAFAEEEPLITIDFRIRATKDQIIGLRDYLRQNNIKFGRVE